MVFGFKFFANKSNENNDVESQRVSSQKSTRKYFRRHGSSRKFLLIFYYVCLASFLCALTGSLGLGFYFSYRRWEKGRFREVFTSSVEQIATSINRNLKSKLASMDVINEIYAYAIEDGYVGVVPNITLPGFEKIMNALSTATLARGISFSPVLDNHNRHEWEAYARENVGLLEGPSSLKISSQGSWTVGKGIYSLNNSNTPVYDIGFRWGRKKLIYTPVWQIAPISSNSIAVMYDTHSNRKNGEVIDHVIETKSTSVTDLVQLVQDEHEIRPSTILLSPVMNNSEDVIGLVASIFSWDDMIRDCLPSSLSGLLFVVSTSSASYTLEITEGKVKVLGKYNIHSQKFDSFKTVITASVPVFTSISSSSDYTLAVYPTEELYSQYVTNAPMYVGAAIVVIIVVTALVVVLLEYLLSKTCPKLSRTLYVSDTHDMTMAAAAFQLKSVEFEVKKKLIRYLCEEVGLPLLLIQSQLQPNFLPDTPENNGGNNSGSSKEDDGGNRDLTINYDQNNDISMKKTDLFGAEPSATATAAATPIGAEVGSVHSRRGSDLHKSESSMTHSGVSFSMEAAIDVMENFTLFNQITSGTLNLNMEEVNIIEFLDTIYEKYRRLASRCNITLLLQNDLSARNVENTAMLFVHADRHYLSILMNQVLINAFKYTSTYGKVIVKLTRKEDVLGKLRQNQYVIEVIDTGVGISKENQKKLFHDVVQFQVMKLRFGRDTGGCGLGLYISQGIITQFGGKISVFSEGEGYGSTFRLEIPVYSVIRSSTRSSNKSVSFHEVEASRPSSRSISRNNRRHTDASVSVRIAAGSRITASGHGNTNMNIASAEGLDVIHKKYESSFAQRYSLLDILQNQTNALKDVQSDSQRIGVYELKLGDIHDPRSERSGNSVDTETLVTINNTKNRVKCVLIVNSDVNQRRILHRMLMLTEFQVKCDDASTGTEAIDKIRRVLLVGEPTRDLDVKANVDTGGNRYQINMDARGEDDIGIVDPSQMNVNDSLRWDKTGINSRGSSPERSHRKVNDVGDSVRSRSRTVSKGSRRENASQRIAAVAVSPGNTDEDDPDVICVSENTKKNRSLSVSSSSPSKPTLDEYGSLRNYDIVIIDEDLRDSTGPLTAKNLRQAGFSGLMIGVTGSSNEDGYDEFMAHGVDKVFVKPLTVQYFDYVLSLQCTRQKL